MAGSTLDPDNAGQPRRRRKSLKGHDTRSLGPSDSSDSGSDVVGPPPAGARIGDREMDDNSDRSGTGERMAAGNEPAMRPGQDRDVDRVVGAGEAGLGRGLDQAEEARQKDIAENAYYRAEKRGFTPGHEERDWLEAEAELKARRKKRR